MLCSICGKDKDCESDYIDGEYGEQRIINTCTDCLSLISELEESLFNKKQYLKHQERDLIACYPPEYEGRVLEIESLKSEIQMIKLEIEKLHAPK